MPSFTDSDAYCKEEDEAGLAERLAWLLSFSYFGVLLCAGFAYFIDSLESINGLEGDWSGIGLDPNSIKLALTLIPFLFITFLIRVVVKTVGKAGALVYCIPIVFLLGAFWLSEDRLMEQAIILFIFCVLGYSLAHTRHLKFPSPWQLAGGPKDKLIEWCSSTVALVFAPIALSTAAGYAFQPSMHVTLPLTSTVTVILTIYARKTGKRSLLAFAALAAVLFVISVWSQFEKLWLALAGF